MNFKRAIPAAVIAVLLAALMFSGNFKIAASIFNTKYFQKPYEALEYIKSSYKVTDGIAVVGDDDFALYLFCGDYSGAFLSEKNCIYVADMAVKNGAYMFTGGINGINPRDTEQTDAGLSLKKAKRGDTVVYWDIIDPQFENEAIFGGESMNSVKFRASTADGEMRELVFVYKVTNTDPHRRQTESI